MKMVHQGPSGSEVLKGAKLNKLKESRTGPSADDWILAVSKKPQDVTGPDTQIRMWVPCGGWLLAYNESDGYILTHIVFIFFLSLFFTCKTYLSSMNRA
jgi:hypothetical protein